MAEIIQIIDFQLKRYEREQVRHNIIGEAVKPKSVDDLPLVGPCVAGLIFDTAPSEITHYHGDECST